MATYITDPNGNSQKASISVNVLAANSQDEVYEGTTRPRPESDKQTRKLDDEMNDIETEEKTSKKYHTSISAPNENSQKASKSVIMIRTGSQMENKLHENVSKKVGRPKEHTG